MNKELNEIVISEGLEIDKIENNKIILKKSKKELPKTWKECYFKFGEGKYTSRHCDIGQEVQSTSSEKENQKMFPTVILPEVLDKPMLALMQLIICREVYRNGWKPDWSNSSKKYCIGITYNDITKHITYNHNKILSFQSEEVRDKFLANFEDLIEEAKELI